MLNAVVKQEQRPLTPPPPAIHKITVEAYEKKSTKYPNKKALDDLRMKKTFLSVLKPFQELWNTERKLSNPRVDREKWREVGIELFSRTNVVVAAFVLIQSFGKMKTAMKRRLRSCIVNKKMNVHETEQSLEKWDIYSYFKWYRYTCLDKYEEEIRGKKYDPDDLKYIKTVTNRKKETEKSKSHDDDVEYLDYADDVTEIPQDAISTREPEQLEVEPNLEEPTGQITEKEKEESFQKPLFDKLHNNGLPLPPTNLRDVTIENVDFIFFRYPEKMNPMRYCFMNAIRKMTVKKYKKTSELWEEMANEEERNERRIAETR